MNEAVAKLVKKVGMPRRMDVTGSDCYPSIDLQWKCGAYASVDEQGTCWLSHKYNRLDVDEAAKKLAPAIRNLDWIHKQYWRERINLAWLAIRTCRTLLLEFDDVSLVALPWMLAIVLDKRIYLRVQEEGKVMVFCDKATILDFTDDIDLAIKTAKDLRLLTTKKNDDTTSPCTRPLENKIQP